MNEEISHVAPSMNKPIFGAKVAHIIEASAVSFYQGSRRFKSPFILTVQLTAQATLLNAGYKY